MLVYVREAEWVRWFGGSFRLEEEDCVEDNVDVFLLNEDMVGL